MRTSNFRVIIPVFLFISITFSTQLFSFSNNNIYISAIDHKGRLVTDIKYDEKRKPSVILPFTEIKQGDKVLELGAGGGYTTELTSWLVGDTGKVYAHFLYNKERLKNNRLSNVVSLPQHSLNEHGKILSELGIEDNKLDAIIIFFVLHDIYLNAEMSDELLSTLYSALKPGGNLIILDNAAESSVGLSKVEALHRIGEDFVKSEIVKAGFVFDGSSDALRNKNDDHSKPWGEFKGLQDRFAFRFKKPDGSAN